LWTPCAICVVKAPDVVACVVSLVWAVKEAAASPGSTAAGVGVAPPEPSVMVAEEY
jgi:hypothetical protein